MYDLKKKEIVLVDCRKWEICLINKVVESDIVKDRLITSLEQNRKIDSLIYYTDGSLGTSESTEKKRMGCRIVQVSEEGQIVQQVALATKKWFSSTRAELVAILVALLITPNKREVKIKTDSKVAILAIERGLKTDKARQWLRIKNSGLVATIVETIKTKKLKLQLTKIKGHSGDFYNDLADVKAKEGANSTELFIPMAVCSKEFKLRYKWENESIKKPIRSFVKMVGKL